MSDLTQPTTHRTEDSYAFREQFLRAFEEACKAGQRPALEDYLPSDLTQKRLVLVELIHLDLTYRLQRGETARVEDYLARYPELAHDRTVVLEWILTEEKTRRTQGAGLDHREYFQRFPQYDDMLRAHWPADSARDDTSDPERTRPDTEQRQRADGEAVPLRHDDRYRLIRFYAAGGLGEVHLAEDLELRREVALKRIKERYRGDEHHRQRFLREAAITGHLEHPGIVPVYGLVEETPDDPWYAMKFIQGESLKDAIKRFHEADTPGREPGERALALRQLLTRFLAVCNTMAFAHSRGYLHRDLKPGNIMLGNYGETLVVDWGLAKKTGDSEQPSRSPPFTGNSDTPEMTTPGQPVGTPAFMSPEQALGQWERVGPASDIYSLGATLYAILTGATPLTGSPKPIPPPLAAICDRAMAREPQARYPTAQALAEDVEHWLADEPVSAYPETWRQRLGRWVRHHSSWVQAGVAALLLVAAISVGAAFWINAARHEAELARGKEAEERGRAVDAQLKEASARRTAEERERSERQTRYVAVARLLEQSWQQGNYAGVLNLLERQRPSPQTSDLRGFEWFHLWQRAHHGGNLTLRGHTGSVTGAVFATTEPLLLTAGLDGTIRFWDPHSGKEKDQIDTALVTGTIGIGVVERAGEFVVSQVAPESPAAREGHIQVNDRILAVSGSDGKMVPTRGLTLAQLLARLRGEPESTVRLEIVAKEAKEGRTVTLTRARRAIPRPVTHLCAAPREAFLVTAYRDGSLGIWDLTRKTETHRFAVDQSALDSLALAPDGRTLATVTTSLLGDHTIRRNGKVQLWSPEGKLLRTLRTGELNPHGVTFTPDGTLLVVGHTAGVQLWEVATGKLKTALSLGMASAYSLACAPDGQSLAVGDDQGRVWLWDIATEKLRMRLHRHTLTVRTLAFAPDGSRLVSAGDDHRFQLWNPATGEHLGTFLNHTNGIHALAFSPDGRSFVSTSDDRKAVLWDAERDQEADPLVGAQGWVNALAFTPEGKSVLTGTGVGGRDTGEVLRWNVATGQLEATLQEGPVMVTGLAFSPDGKRMAIALGILQGGPGQPRGLEVWDLTTGQRELVLRGHNQVIDAMVFSRDGKMLLTVANELSPELSTTKRSELKWWDLATGNELRSGTPTQGAIDSVALSEDGKVLAVPIAGTILLINVTTGHVQGRLVSPLKHIHCCAFSPDGRWLVLGHAHPTGEYQQPAEVTVWDVARGKLQATLKGHQGVVSCLAFSPDGKILASGSMDKTVRLWDPTGKGVPVVCAHNFPVVALSYSAGDRGFVAAGAALGPFTTGLREWKRWSVAGKELSAQKNTRGEAVVAFDPTGALLATETGNAVVTLFDVATGKETQVVRAPLPSSKERHKQGITAVAVSPEGRYAATGSYDRTVKLWDLERNRVLATFTDHQAPITALAFSPDGKWLASGSGGTPLNPGPGEVRLWDVAARKAKGALPSHPHGVVALAFTPDSQTLVWATGKGANADPSQHAEVILSEVASGQTRRTLPGKEVVLVSALALSPDGKMLATGTIHRPTNGATMYGVALWDLASGEKRSVLLGHQGSVLIRGLAFSPDGKTLASSADDQTVRLWNVATGEVMLTLKGVPDPRSNLAFASDGRTLAAGGIERSLGMVKLWRAAPRQESDPPAQRP